MATVLWLLVLRGEANQTNVWSVDGFGSYRRLLQWRR